MKSTKFFMLASLTLSVVACSNDKEVVNNDPVEARITAGLTNAAESRAIDAKWNQDNIGVMVTAAPTSDMENMYKNVKYSTTSTDVNATFTAETGKGIFFQDATETVTFAAYAPYQTSAAANTLPGTNGVIAVDTENNNATVAAQETIDFLFAKGATATESSPNVSFSGDAASFFHKMAKLVLEIKVSTDDGLANEDIEKITAITLSGLKLGGTFNVTDGTATATSEAKTGWNIYGFNKTTATGSYTYSLILLPQVLSTPLDLDIVLDGQTYCNNTSINSNLEAGKVYTYTITVKKTGITVSGCNIKDWEMGTTGTGDALM